MPCCGLEQPPCDVATRSEALETASPALPLADNIAGIGEIFSGPSIDLDTTTIRRRFTHAGHPGDSQYRRDLFEQYQAKLAEHGGFAHDDTNVILLVSNPNISANTVTTPVQTATVAPTILKALGLNPQSLKAVQLEHTPVLPGLSLPE